MHRKRFPQEQKENKNLEHIVCQCNWLLAIIFFTKLCFHKFRKPISKMLISAMNDLAHIKMLISTMNDRAPGARKCKKKVVYPFNLNRTATAEQKQAPKNAAESGKRGLQRKRHCRNARDDGIQPSLVEDHTQHYSRARGVKERTRRDTAIAGKRTLWRTEKTTTGNRLLRLSGRGTTAAVDRAVHVDINECHNECNN